MGGRTLRIKATVQVIVGILLLVFLPLSIETFVAVFLLGSTAICAVVWIFVQNKTLLRVLLWLIPLTAIMQLEQLLGLVRYEFLSGESMPFWLSCLICTVSVMAVAIIFFIRFKIRIWSSIIGILLIGIFSFSLTNGVANNLNYACDTSEPVLCESVIYVKDLNIYRRNFDSYTFDVIVDGRKISLRVPRSVYNDYEVGDTFSFVKCQGAFGEPFYAA